MDTEDQASDPGQGNQNAPKQVKKSPFSHYTATTFVEYVRSVEAANPRATWTQIVGCCHMAWY